MSRSLHRLVLALAFPAAALGAPAALAQGPTLTASMAVDLTIVAPLTLAVTQKLDFGRMLAATKQTIAPSAANAGRFEVTGTSGSSIAVTLMMPTVVAGPGASIPITAWNYLMSESATFSGATPVTFNAGQVIPVAATLSGSTGTTKLYFAVGATTFPSGGQIPGLYTATGTITAAYADL